MSERVVHCTGGHTPKIDTQRLRIQFLLGVQHYPLQYLECHHRPFGFDVALERTPETAVVNYLDAYIVLRIESA
jgi:hypothetical protein